MSPDREVSAVFDRLAAELIELARNAQCLARVASTRRLSLSDLSEATGIVNDTRACLDAAKGGRALLRMSVERGRHG